MFIPKPDNITEENWIRYYTDFREASNTKSKLQNAELAKRGYRYNTNESKYYTMGPFKAPNGKIYKNHDDFWNGEHQNPLLEKNGMFYGLYQALYIENIDVKMEFPNLKDYES